MSKAIFFQMEQHWIQWGIFWTIIPITLVLFWMLSNYFDKSNNKFKCKEMTNSSIIKTNSKVIENTASGQPKVMTSATCNDIIERMNLLEEGTYFKGQFSSSLTSQDRKNPPDIFVINEKGKPVQYIMCV